MSTTSIAGKMGIMSLIMSAGLVVKLVILLLLILSVICWAIIFFKIKQLKKAQQESSDFLQIFMKAKNLDDVSAVTRNYKSSPSARVFMAGHFELSREVMRAKDEDGPFSSSKIEVVSRSLRKAESEEISSLERHLSFLATTGSAAPFIGLFGTVWGIMNSFQMIGATGTANLAVVAPGVSEALIATAIGLAAAIPAVVFYNIFVEKIRRLSNELDNLVLEFLNISERGLRRYRGEGN